MIDKTLKDQMIELERIRENSYQLTELPFLDGAIARIKERLNESYSDQSRVSSELVAKVFPQSTDVEERFVATIRKFGRPLKIGEVKRHLSGLSNESEDRIKSAKRKLIRSGKVATIKFNNSNQLTFLATPDMLDETGIKLKPQFIPTGVPKDLRANYEITNQERLESV